MAISGDPASNPTAEPGSRRSEVWLAVGLIGSGFLLLPALIYVTGTVLLGAYGGGEHLGAFYGDFVRDLGSGSPRAWLLVLGPYLLVQLGRLVLRDFSATSEAPPVGPDEGRKTQRAGTPPRERREPTIKL